ncbi:MAG: hypothetical protein HY954_07420 [Deltaproteobacteria bacterium]|nr:hypothetical protein [Deltaproteobacteria bacterium]
MWRTSNENIRLNNRINLISPIAAFSSNAEDIIKQQKTNAANERKKEVTKAEKQKAMDRCIDELTKVVAKKIKELMDAGVQFKKNPGVWRYKYIGGQRYANDGQINSFIRTSMYEDRLLVLSDFSTDIQFQPENGTKVNMGLEFYTDGTWKMETVGYYEEPNGNTINFNSYFDIAEINKKKDSIHKNIVEAIKAAVEYGDK